MIVSSENGNQKRHCTKEDRLLIDQVSNISCIDPMYDTSRHLKRNKVHQSKIFVKSMELLNFTTYLTNGTHLMVTDNTTAIIPKPQHRACISLGFFSQLQDTMLQFGRATSTLTMLDKKSLVQPPVPMAMASQMDKSGTRPRICSPRDIVSRTWASLDNLIPLSTLTLKLQKMIDVSWIAI